MSSLSAYDIHNELLVQRYRNGIQLTKPKGNPSEAPANSISSIYNLPIYIYFFNLDSQYVSLNSPCTEALGAESSSEASGKNLEYFFDKETNEQLLKNNYDVINSNQLNILEERGALNNDGELRTISFKFPWYFAKQIIGVMGCSVSIKNSFDLFTKGVSLLTETGLLMPAEASPSALTVGGSSPTAREMEILQVLAKGKTIKKIARELGISPRTVDTHLVNIKTKLNLKHREELVAYYWNLLGRHV